MNQRGEVTLLSCLLILVLSGLVLLCGLELRRSFKLLEARTKLYLCAKETKGELHYFIKFMGRTNWAIKNMNRVSLIMMFIPGLQGTAMSTQKKKKFIQYLQEGRVVSFMKTMYHLKGKGCPLDPRMYITPFILGSRLLKRDSEGAAVLRNEAWTYYFFSKPYVLSLEINSHQWENINPKIKYISQEKKVRLSSLFSFP